MFSGQRTKMTVFVVVGLLVLAIGAGSAVAQGQQECGFFCKLWNFLTGGDSSSPGRLPITGLVGDSNSSCVQPPSNLVSWWPGDGNASDIKDANPGTLMNGALANATGKVGQAFSFDGVNDYVSVPDSDSWTFGTSGFSIDFWVKLNEASPASRKPIISGGSSISSNSNTFAFFQGTGGNWEISLHNTNKVWAHSSASDTTNWHHIAIVRQSGINDFYVFVDGIQLSGAVFSGSWGIANVNFDWTAVLFGRGWEIGFNGLIDEVEIYNRSLNSSEIQAIFNAGSAGKCKVAVVCGNNITETGEVCDGTDLAGKTCTTQGFLGGGTLSCNPTCAGFNTSQCVSVCGNSVVEPDELCDPAGSVVGTCNTGLFGICATGSSTCAAGCKSAQCVQTVFPKAENNNTACSDGLDNDCDGFTDFPNDTNSCNIGVALPLCLVPGDLNNDSATNILDAIIAQKVGIAFNFSTTLAGCQHSYITIV